MVAIREVAYEVDGRQMVGTLAVPDGSGPRPAVLIGHEGPGLDPVQKDRARRIAVERGYVAFALDYQGGGQMLTDRDVMMARLDELFADPERTQALGQAGLDVLLAEPWADASRVAAIGYCFGGTIALELARGGVDLAAIVGFHAGLTTTRPEAAANITGRVLMCMGADDPIVTVDQRSAFEAEMRAGGVDWRMHVYGGATHSFTHPGADRVAVEGFGYHELAARRSWRAMLDLFDEVFGA